MPVYGILGYQFPVTKGPIPEMFAQYGYSFSLREDYTKTDEYGKDFFYYDGGSYFAIGMGVIYKDLVVQGLFRINNLETSWKYTEFNNDDAYTNSMDSQFRQLTIQLGYRFDSLLTNP